MQAMRLIWQDPFLRMIGLATMLYGTIIASFEPYRSLLGIEIFGLSDSQYAAMLGLSMAVSLGAAIGVGILTDQTASRRLMALLAIVSALLATGSVWLANTVTAFVIAHALLLPLAATMIGQLFAVTRLATMHLPGPDRDGATAVIRALFAVPFAVVLPLWGVLFDNGLPVITLYPALFVFGLGFLALIWLRWPRDQDAPWQDEKSGLGFVASVKELLAGRIVWRIVWMGAVHSGATLMSVLLALVFAEATSRSTGDVGLFFGAFVAIEIVVMLFVGTLARYIRRLHIIFVGASFYAIFLILLPLLANSPAIWWLILPVAVGGGLIYGLSISYLQDLLGARAGAGASLVAVQRLVSEGMAAVIFAIGAALSGYTLAAIMGAVLIMTGATMLLYLDRVSRP